MHIFQIATAKLTVALKNCYNLRDRFFMFMDLWFKIHMTVSEWVYDCTDYPGPPKRKQRRYWDFEGHGVLAWHLISCG